MGLYCPHVLPHTVGDRDVSPGLLHRKLHLVVAGATPAGSLGRSARIPLLCPLSDGRPLLSPRPASQCGSSSSVSPPQSGGVSVVRWLLLCLTGFVIPLALHSHTLCCCSALPTRPGLVLVVLRLHLHPQLGTGSLLPHAWLAPGSVVAPGSPLSSQEHSRIFLAFGQQRFWTSPGKRAM